MNRREAETPRRSWQPKNEMAINLSSLADAEFLLLAEDIDRHRGLKDVLVWAAGKPRDEMHPQIVAEVITQDEFTHGVIVPTNIYF